MFDKFAESENTKEKKVKETAGIVNIDIYFALNT
jgi:hypothetical protein